MLISRISPQSKSACFQLLGYGASARSNHGSILYTCQASARLVGAGVGHFFDEPKASSTQYRKELEMANVVGSYVR